MAPRIAYLTGDQAPVAGLAPFVRSWRVVETLPLDLKSLRARVRDREIGRLEIRKRGVDVSPEALRASLRLAGDVGETWVVTRLGGGRSPRGAVIVVEQRDEAVSGSLSGSLSGPLSGPLSRPR